MWAERYNSWGFIDVKCSIRVAILKKVPFSILHMLSNIPCSKDGNASSGTVNISNCLNDTWLTILL